MVSLEELLQKATPSQLEQYEYLQKTYATTVDIDVGYRYLHISILRKLPNQKYACNPTTNPFYVREFYPQSQGSSGRPSKKLSKIQQAWAAFADN
jgi:hypothetical protein